MDIINDLEIDGILEKISEYIKSKFTDKNTEDLNTEDKNTDLNTEDKNTEDKNKKNFTFNLGITRIDYQKDIEGKEIILVIFTLLILYLFKNIF